MIVQHGLTPEQVDKLPLGILDMVPLVSAFHNRPPEAPNARQY